MISVKVKKGYQVKAAGAPSTDLAVLETPSHLALLPERIPFVKPRLIVEVGDFVQKGSPLFEDKRNPEIRFLSPGGGRITEINLGPRRVIQEIVIELNASEGSIEFTSLSETDLDTVDRQALVRMITEGGMWACLKALPFRDMPHPSEEPPAILVTVGNLEPFHPKPGIYLEGKGALFRYGIKVLQRLSKGPVHVAAAENDGFVRSELNGIISQTYSGRYPAHDAGVLVYHTKSSAEENRTWYIDAQDLLLLAEMLNTGVFPTERTVAVAGSLVQHQRHVKTRIGVPLKHLAGEIIGGRTPRYVAGGIMTGYAACAGSYLGLFETSLVVLPEGDERELLALFRAGYRKPSFSRAFLSVVNTGEFDMDCNRHGGLRACIACNHCTEVCPVDILPQMTYKSILAEEIEEALAHGLLDCVECGLCTYVCPSKIELYTVLKNARAAYYKEQTGT